MMRIFMKGQVLASMRKRQIIIVPLRIWRKVLVIFTSLLKRLTHFDEVSIPSMKLTSYD